MLSIFFFFTFKLTHYNYIYIYILTFSPQLTVPEFSLLISLIGAMGGASLQFVLPALFHLKLFPEASTPRKALSVLYIIFGLVGGGYGTYDTISQLIDKL